MTAILVQRVDEVKLWCSLQELTAFHQDSPEQTRRRDLHKRGESPIGDDEIPGGELASTISTQRAALDTRHESIERGRPRLIGTA